MELKLEEPHALDRLAFDMLNAGDEEEVEFVIVDDEPFHLCRVHAAEWLRHIKHRDAQIRKDVSRHAIQRKKSNQC